MTRNLAYIALLAGWLCFCYWLYAEEIVPKLYKGQETFWSDYVEELPYPMAFSWASDELLIGTGFSAVKADMERIDTTDEVLILHGYYFRDEKEDIIQLQDLANQRIDQLLDYVHVDHRRTLRVLDAQAINGDVKANPFEAIRYEHVEIASLIFPTKDTLELCFPLKDLIDLPTLMEDRLLRWIKASGKDKESFIHLIGIADGGGIAESSDIALERALYIKEKLLNDGWENDQILISSGQRNHSLTLQNRCVVIYFE